MKKLLAIAALMLGGAFASTAHADDITLGTPSVQGTGCPEGTVDVALTDDQKSLSILFGAFVVDAGGATNKSFNRMICNIAIPVHVPQGLSVSILAIDYRGHNEIPAGAKSTFGV